MNARLSRILPVVLLALVLLACGALFMLHGGNHDVQEPAPVRTDDSPLVITELMTLNSAGYRDAAGRYCQWAELKNVSGSPVELSGYTLVFADAAAPLSGTLAPGEVTLTVSSDWGFLLPTRGTLELHRGKRVVFSAEYDNKRENCSWLFASGEETGFPTPGYEEQRAPDALRISEVMSDNDTLPVGGRLADWVELYNAGEAAVDLGEYFLSRDASNPYKCRLPDLTLAPGEYALLVCGQELDFNIAKEGCTLILTRGDGVCAESASIPALASGESYTYDTGVVSCPTPGLANTGENRAAAFVPTGLCISELMSSNHSCPIGEDTCDWVELYNAGSESAELSEYTLGKKKDGSDAAPLPAGTLAPGEYTVIPCDRKAMPFKLSADGVRLILRRGKEIADLVTAPAVPSDRSYGRSGEQLLYYAAPTPGAPNGTGYPTLCPAPAASVPSGFYTEPFTVTLSGEGDIYYTTDGTTPTAHSTLYRGEAIPVEETMAIRALAADGKRISSDSVTFNYFLNEPDYELDVLKLCVAPGHFSFGLNVSSTNERFPASLSLYHEGKEEFSVNCGVSLFGSGSRILDKKSFQINFQYPYGPTKLRYQLFDDLPLDSFNSLIIRSGSQDHSYSMLRDEFLTALFRDAGADVLTQSFRPVNLYINGRYWGIYYIRERVTDEMIADHYGVTPESVTIMRKLEVCACGSDAEQWKSVYKLAASSDLTVEENYRRVAAQLDIESCIDYFIASMWGHNYDIGNVKVFYSPELDSRWHFVLFDMDVALMKNNQLSVVMQCGSYMHLLENLMTNEGFKAAFTRRMAELLHGPLQEETVLAGLEDFIAMIENDMVYNCERWPACVSYEGWRKELDWLRAGKDAGITGRTDSLIRQYIDCVHPDEALIRECFGAEYCP